MTEHDYDHTATLGVTKVISPTLISDFRLGYNRFVANVTGPDVNAGTAQLLGIPNVSAAYLPGGLPLTVGTPSLNVLENFTLKDDVTWVKNKHSFKFGFEFRRLNYQDNITFLLGDEYGDYIFTGNFTSTGVPKNGDVHGFADFLLGYVADAQQAQNGPDGKPYGYHYGGYVQDEWRLTPNLTLNYGLRYDTMHGDVGKRDAEITAHASFRKRLYDHDVVPDAQKAALELT